VRHPLPLIPAKAGIQQAAPHRVISVFHAENIGTYTQTWIYPNQRGGWHPVGCAKLGSCFLLLIISYTLVALIKHEDLRRRL